MFILSALGLALAAAGTAYGWWGAQKGADEAERISEENARAIEENAKQNEWLNHVAESRFAEEQSVDLGGIGAGISKQQMSGTPGGEAYQDTSERTAEMDKFLMKYKDNAEVQNLMKQAQIVRQGGQASADAMRTSGNANAISGLGNLAVRSGPLYEQGKAWWASWGNDSNLLDKGNGTKPMTGGAR
jgi:hypothetical protein